MSALTIIPDISAKDRLGLTLFISVIVHAVIILGVVFTANTSEDKEDPSPPLEIILAYSAADKPSDDAQYLAQANQDGSGNTTKKVRPRNPMPAPQGSMLMGMSDKMSLPTVAENEPLKLNDKFITTDQQSSTRIRSEDNQPNVTADTPSAAELIRRSEEIARLSTEISESMEAYAKMPKHRYISAQSKAYRDAAYLEAWRTKIENIGNLNYPEEAKRRNLSGSLILDVAINPDGSLHHIELRRSSGSKILDDAAIRIVKLASPFAAFPPGMRKDTDVLHITRTWQFLSGNRFETQM